METVRKIEKFGNILGVESFCLDLGKIFFAFQNVVCLLSDGLLKSKLCIFTAACHVDCPLYKDFKTSRPFTMP